MNGTSASLQDLLDESERRRSCATARDSASKRCLLRGKSSGALVSPHPELFVRRQTWSAAQQDAPLRVRFLVNGLAALHPGWVFCQSTAAVLHGLPVSYNMLDKIHVASAPGSHYRDSGPIAFHRIASPNPTLVEGVRVTSFARTVLDVLRTSSFPDALAVADGAIRARGWTRVDLIDMLESEGRRVPHHMRALEVAQHADARSESGGESIARALMLSLGFVPPQLQVWVDNPLHPEHPFRVDYLWILPNGTVVIGELDGREKYTNPSQNGGLGIVGSLANERIRESLISITGARIMRFSFAELRDLSEFERKMTAFGIPKADSLAGRRMRSSKSAMHGGEPGPGGAFVRDGRLQFYGPCL